MKIEWFNARIIKATFGTLSAEHKLTNQATYNFWDIAFSLIVIAIVAYIMISFTG